jgi:cytochrome c biogenesis protein ResB
MRKSAVWKFFTSIKLTVVLLIVIVIASVIGTVIPQDEEPAIYVRNYGETMYRLLLAIGFTKVYHSWWFIGLLLLFSVNLLLCTINRFPFKLRSAGFVLTHLSILLILVGVFIGGLLGEGGFIAKYREVIAPQAQIAVNLGFLSGWKLRN